MLPLQALNQIARDLTYQGTPFILGASRRSHSHSVVKALKAAKRRGRGIRRLITLCGTVTQLVAENDRRLVLESDDDADIDLENADGDGDEGDDAESREEMKRQVFQLLAYISTFSRFRTGHFRRRNRDYQSYLELIKLIPSLKDVIADPGHEGSRMDYYAQVRCQLNLLCDFSHRCHSKLLEGANNARSDDTSRVKSAVASLLNNRASGRPNVPLDLDTRDQRGLQNDVTGRLLCPIKYDWDDAE